MSVCFSNEHIYVQFIDDAAGVTLAAASTLGKAVPDRTSSTATWLPPRLSAPGRRKPPKARASNRSCLTAAGALSRQSEGPGGRGARGWPEILINPNEYCG